MSLNWTLDLRSTLRSSTQGLHQLHQEGFAHRYILYYRYQQCDPFPKKDLGKCWYSIWTSTRIHNPFPQPHPSVWSASNDEWHLMVMTHNDITNQSKCSPPLIFLLWQIYQVPHHWHWCGNQMTKDNRFIVCCCSLVSSPIPTYLPWPINRQQHGTTAHHAHQHPQMAISDGHG